MFGILYSSYMKACVSENIIEVSTKFLKQVLIT